MPATADGGTMALRCAVVISGIKIPLVVEFALIIAALFGEIVTLWAKAVKIAKNKIKNGVIVFFMG
jgi:hypothetical protein